MKQHFLPRLLKRTILEHRLAFAGLCVAIVVGITAGLLPPLVLERIVNTLVSGEMIAPTLAFLYFAMTLLSSLAESARASLLTLFGQHMTYTLRLDMSQKLTRLTTASFVRTDPGTMTAHFVGDVNAVEELFTSGIVSMAVDVCRIVSILAVIFTKSIGLGVMMLLLIPLLFAFTRAVQKRMLAAQLDNRKALALASALVPETIANIRTVQTYRRERFMEKKYDQSVADGYTAKERVNLYDALYSPVILVVRAILIAVVVVLCATRVPALTAFFGMSVGATVAVIQYIIKVFAPLDSIGMEIQTIQSAVAGVKRIGDFFEREEIPAKFEKVDTDKNVPMIEMEHVEFAYDESCVVLKDVSFTIGRGEQVTLTGRTGVGKSTIFKLLLGLYVPQRGTVRICGTEADRVSPEERRSLIGYVEQDFARVPGTVLNQVTLFDSRISREDALRALKTVGLSEIVEKLENGCDSVCSEELFSRGQWQLLSIARAVAADPKILLLDEITANLDSDTEQAVLKALKAASADRTVLSISHRLYEEIGGRRIHLAEE